MSVSKKLGIIGVGKVGRAFILGFKKSGAYSPDTISVATLLVEDQTWARSQSCTVYESNIMLVKNCDFVLLLVRPEVIKTVLSEIRHHLTENHFIVSVAAGVKLATIESQLLAGVSVCRVMINLQIETCLGTSAVTPGSHCSKEDLEFFILLMSALGYCTQIPEENLDTFTALAGSGPAFVYGVIEALAEGATLNGLPRKQAIEIATSMVKGSAAHAMDKINDCHPCQLREAVCTPGGSSIQGVRALEERGFRAAFIAAIDAAVKKNKEFSEKY